MKAIQIFDPALCCSSGVCGTDMDQQLVDFSADADWAKQRGAHLERFNLAQQPMAFAQNSIVKDLLSQQGEAALPVILVDGQLGLTGSYPTREVLAAWLGLASEAPEPICCDAMAASSATAKTSACCSVSTNNAAQPAAKCC